MHHVSNRRQKKEGEAKGAVEMHSEERTKGGVIGVKEEADFLSYMYYPP